MFAHQLNALCSRPGRSITNLALAHSLTAQGCPISTTYLSQLRNGVRTRPASRIVRALATYFEVPVEYFYPATISDEDSASEVDPTIVDNLLDPAMRRLLTCSQDLSRSSMHVLTEVARHLRAAENLPSQRADSHLN